MYYKYERTASSRLSQFSMAGKRVKKLLKHLKFNITLYILAGYKNQNIVLQIVGWLFKLT